MEHLKNEDILVTGNRDIHHVAVEYGWTKAVTTGEVVTAHPTVWPYDCGHKLLPLDESRRDHPNIINYDPTNISAVAVLMDGHCWGSELQVMMDVLMFGKKMDGHDHPPFYYTGNDLQWITEYKYMRIGQGVYVNMVMDTYQRLTGKTLNAVQFGKPTKATFDYAETVLMNEAAKLGYDGIEEVYMVGDFPDTGTEIVGKHEANLFLMELIFLCADIVGGNNKGWNTVLLKTGVYQDGMDTANPTTIQENVQEGVDWICARHGS